MPKASELRKGDVVQINGHLWIVRNIDVKSPSSRGAVTLYKTRFSRVPDGQKLEQTFSGDDLLEGASLTRTPVQMLYREGDLIHFMATEDYSQYSLAESELEEQLPYLHDGIEGLTGLIVDEQMIALELPASVVMEIVETAPAMKAASASARTKPARLPTGLEVQVPEYLEPGEKIRINTQTGKFMGRA